METTPGRGAPIPAPLWFFFSSTRGLPPLGARACSRLCPTASCPDMAGRWPRVSPRWSWERDSAALASTWRVRASLWPWGAQVEERLRGGRPPMLLRRRHTLPGPGLGPGPGPAPRGVSSSGQFLPTRSFQVRSQPACLPPPSGALSAGCPPLQRPQGHSWPPALASAPALRGSDTAAASPAVLRGSLELGLPPFSALPPCAAPPGSLPEVLGWRGGTGREPRAGPCAGAGTGGGRERGGAGLRIQAAQAAVAGGIAWRGRGERCMALIRVG